MKQWIEGGGDSKGIEGPKMMNKSYKQAQGA